MPHKMIVTDKGEVQLRLDGAFTFTEKTLTTPNPKGRCFGSFKFTEESETGIIKLLQEAKKVLELDEDNIFFGDFPIWDEDEYGRFFRVSNRVVFLQDIETKEEVDVSEVRNYNYSLEVHIKKTAKDGKAYVRVPRAIVYGTREEQTNDDLFVDFLGAEVSEDDLPF